ncbi:hypothetical protein QAD02_000469 [Eretmocerus hayati]|uniref:Uncharacterized protein n=1 Tax=Eretmocerus hayati TaxID=131215 RepID=A0ACC2NI27_9HYME|nr:hypothetical protein QAD02_000469 [Eretmocerus hayati]
MVSPCKEGYNENIATRAALLRISEPEVLQDRGWRGARGGRPGRGHPIILELPALVARRVEIDEIFEEEPAAQDISARPGNPPEVNPPANPAGLAENVAALGQQPPVADPAPAVQARLPAQKVVARHNNQGRRSQRKPKPYGMNKQIKKLQEENKLLQGEKTEILRDQKERARSKELLAEETGRTMASEKGLLFNSVSYMCPQPGAPAIQVLQPPIYHPPPMYHPTTPAVYHQPTVPTLYPQPGPAIYPAGYQHYPPQLPSVQMFSRQQTGQYFQYL